MTWRKVRPRRRMLVRVESFDKIDSDSLSVDRLVPDPPQGDSQRAIENGTVNTGTERFRSVGTRSFGDTIRGTCVTQNQRMQHSSATSVTGTERKTWSTHASVVRPRKKDACVGSRARTRLTTKACRPCGCNSVCGRATQMWLGD